MIFISQTLEISKEKLKHKTFLMRDTATEVIMHIKYRHISICWPELLNEV